MAWHLDKHPSIKVALHNYGDTPLNSSFHYGDTPLNYSFKRITVNYGDAAHICLFRAARHIDLC